MNLKCKTHSVWYIVSDKYQLSLLEVILSLPNTFIQHQAPHLLLSSFNQLSSSFLWDL